MQEPSWEQRDFRDVTGLSSGKAKFSILKKKIWKSNLTWFSKWAMGYLFLLWQNENNYMCRINSFEYCIHRDIWYRCIIYAHLYIHIYSMCIYLCLQKHKTFTASRVKCHTVWVSSVFLFKFHLPLCHPGNQWSLAYKGDSQQVRASFPHLVL